MNAALHMLTPLRFPTTLNVLMAIYVGWWIVGLPLHFVPSGKPLHTLLLPACVLTVVMVTTQLATFGTAMHVLGERRAPAGFVLDTARSSFVQLGVAHLALVGSIAFHFAVPKVGIGFLTAPAILSVLACLTLGCVLLQRASPSLCSAGVMLATLTLLGKFGQLSTLLFWIDGQHALVLALCAILWPMLLCGVALDPRRALGVNARLRAARPDRLARWITDLSRRISFLNWQRDLVSAGKLSFGGAQNGMGVAGLALLLPNLMIVPAAGHAFTVLHVKLLLLALVLVCRALPAFDVHWRAVLAPGGWRRGRIGARLWTAAMLYYGSIVVASTVSLGLVYTLAGSPTVWMDAATVLVSALQLAAFLAVAVLVRGALRSLMWPTLALIALMLGIFATGNEFTAFMTLRDSALYVPFLLGVTGACLLLANRAWTIDKLMAAART